jgi:hypothetical protein
MVKIDAMRLLLFIFLAVIASKVQADAVSDFRENAKVLPKALLSKGYHRIGSLDFDSFLSRVGKMNVQEADQIKHREDLGGGIMMERNLAECRRTPTGDVKIAGARWLKTPAEIRPLVALHESLCALKFSDSILTCSGALQILADDEARATLGNDEIVRIETIANSACVIAGGSTGVTGGGDDFIARVRINSLKKGLAELRSGKDRTQVASDLESSLFIDLERNRSFKRKNSIFDPKYKNTKQCLDPARGTAIESTIKVFYEERPILRDSQNGWTFDEATNCVHFHGAAVHGWAGYAVMYSSRR